MNIIVCAKQIQATYARTGKLPEANYLNIEDSIFRVNPYDEAAMALAVGVKQATGSDTRITVVTLAPMIAEDDLWRLMGMGGDRLCRIETGDAQDINGQAAGLDSWRRAQILARAARSLKADLVLCGKESQDRQNGLIGAYMARLLDFPLVSSIMNLELRSGDSARVTKNAGKGRREIIDCRLPAVFSVDIVPTPFPVPSYAAVQKARSKEVLHMVADTAAASAKTRCLAQTAPRPRPKPIEAPAGALSSYDRVRQLLSGSAIQKTGKVVTGSPETQVDAIMDFLTEHGFIPEKKTA